MLKMHQRYGLITLGAMVATVAVSGLAGGRNNTAMGGDIHGALGSVTADMYFMAAYYAIRAPRIPGTPVPAFKRLRSISCRGGGAVDVASDRVMFART